MVGNSWEVTVCVLIFEVLFQRILTTAGTPILVSNGSAILRVDTENKTKTVVISKPFGRIVGVAVDLDDDWLFWSDISKDSLGIFRSRINGSDSHILIGDVQEVNSLTVDWVSQHLYWTDGQQSTINIANYDGTGRYVLIALGPGHEPRGIIADSILGYIFWTDQRKGTVEKARLNGKDKRVLVDKDIYWPNQLAISRVFRKLYWVEASPRGGIMSCDLDGDNFRMERHLFKITDRNPSFGLVVIGNKALVSTWFINVIYSTLVETPYSVWTKEVSELGTEELFSIAALDFTSQPKASHVCSGTQRDECSHICLPSGWGQHFSCACPSFQDMSLDADGKICQVPDSLLFYTFQSTGEVGFISLDNITIPQSTIVAFSQSPNAVAYDIQEKVVYWSDNDNILYRTYLGSSKREIFLDETGGIGNITNIVIDDSTRYMYFINKGFYITGQLSTQHQWTRIELIHLDSGDRKYIAEMESDITGLLVDTVNGYMYYIQSGNNPGIMRRTLNGKYPTQVLPLTSDGYHMVEVLPHEDEIVLYCLCTKRTVKCNMRQKECATLDSETVSWRVDIPFTYFAVYRKQSKVIDTDLNVYQNHSIESNNGTEQHPCSSAPCSHLCFPASTNHSLPYICDCPDLTMLMLSNDAVTCRRPKNFLLVADVNKISVIDLDEDSYKGMKVLYVVHHLGNVVSIAYDESHDLLYWTDQSRFQIMSLNLTSMEAASILHTDQMLGQLLVDSYGQVLYWTSWNRSMNGRINLINLGDKVKSNIARDLERKTKNGIHVLFETDNIPTSCTLSSDGRHIYWTEFKKGRGLLHTIEMKTSEHVMVNLIDSIHFTAIKAMVISDDVLYVSDEQGNVGMINTNNTLQETKFFRSLTPNIHDMEVINGLMIYTDHSEGSMGMVSMETGRKQILESDFFLPTDLILHHPTNISDYSACTNNSQCSDFCTHLPNAEYWCYCSPGYQLKENKDCIQADDPWTVVSPDYCPEMTNQDSSVTCANFISSLFYEEVCVPGYYRNESSCQACPPDTYKTTHGNDMSCLPCLVDRTTRNLSAAINCSCIDESSSLVNGSCQDNQQPTTDNQQPTTVSDHATTTSHSTQPIRTITPTEENTTPFKWEKTTEQMLMEPNYEQQSWPVFDNCPDGETLILNVPAFRNKVRLPVTWTAYDDKGNELDIQSNYPIKKGQITLGWVSNDVKGTQIVENVATDRSGRSSKCQIQVMVLDNEPPVFTYCPHALTIPSQDTSDRVFWLKPQAEDNVKLDKVISSHNPGNLFSIGETMVTNMAVDGAGNSAWCNFTITVYEAMKPCKLPSIQHGDFACDRKFGSLQEECYIVCNTNYIINPLKLFSEKFDCENQKQIDDLNDILKRQDPCLGIRIPSVVTQEFTMTFKGICDEGDIDLQKGLSAAVVEYIAARNICPIPKCGYSNVTVDCNAKPDVNSLNKAIQHESKLFRRSLQHADSFEVKWNVTIDNSTGFYYGQIEEILVNLKLELTKLLQSPLYVGDAVYMAVPDTIVLSNLIWACQEGEISTTKGCVGCPKGTRHEVITNSCILCQVGTFQSYDSQTSCIPCGPDKTSMEGTVSETSCVAVKQSLDEMSKFLIISACSFGFVFLVMTLILYLHYKRQQKRNQDSTTCDGHKYITPNIYVAPPPIPRLQQNSKRTSPRNSPLMNRKYSPKPSFKNSPKNSPVLSCKSDILRMPGLMREEGTLSSQRFNIYRNHDYEDLGYQTTLSNRTNLSTRTNASGKTLYGNNSGPGSPPTTPCSLGSRVQLDQRSPFGSRSPIGSRSPLGSPVSERAIYTGDFRNFSPSYQTNSLRSNRERQLFLYEK